MLHHWQCFTLFLWYFITCSAFFAEFLKYLLHPWQTIVWVSDLFLYPFTSEPFFGVAGLACSVSVSACCGGSGVWSAGSLVPAVVAGWGGPGARSLGSLCAGVPRLEIWCTSLRWSYSSNSAGKCMKHMLQECGRCTSCMWLDSSSKVV